MTCDECRDRLSELIEGDLPPEKEREVRAHVRACKACARELEELRATVAVLHDLPEMEPPQELRERLRRVPESAQRRRPSRVRSIVLTVGAAAAAVLVAWTGAWVFRTQLGGSPSEQMIAEGPSAPAEEAVGAAREAEAHAPEADVLLAEEAMEERTIESEMVEAESSDQEPEGEAVEAEAPAHHPGPAEERGAPLPADEREETAEGGLCQPPPPRTRASEAEQVPAESPPPPPTDRIAAAPSDSAAPRAGAAGGASGPQGPQAPMGRAGPQELEGAEAPRGVSGEPSLSARAPQYLAAEETEVAQADSGSPFTVAVLPPRERVTGEVVPATVTVETERDVTRAQVNVRASEGLELFDVDEEGLVYDGALTAGQKTVLSVRMLARRPGEQALTMRLRSTDPVVDTELEVGLGDFARPVPPNERRVRFDFVGVSVRDAVAEVVRQSGVRVVVDEEAAERTVTVRAADAIPAAAALRAIAETARMSVSRDGDTFVIETTDGE